MTHLSTYIYLKFTCTYVVSKKDAVITVTWIDPGVADEVDLAFSWYIIDHNVLKEELIMVIILDNDGTRDARLSSHSKTTGSSDFPVSTFEGFAHCWR